jgi:hypothetical protein
MRAKLASLILLTSIISVTQICCAGHGKTKHAPIIQAQKSTPTTPAIEKRRETRDSKAQRGGTLVSMVQLLQ